MLRYFVTYRWELWLIIGIPAISTGTFSIFAYLTSLGSLDHQAAARADAFGVSVVALLLLAVSYLSLRRLGREFLSLIWGYSIAAAAITTIAMATAFFVEVAYPGASNLAQVGRSITIFGLVVPVQLSALLWFARQLSRISLMHAFFLVVYAAWQLTVAVGYSSAESTEGSLYTTLSGVGFR